MNDAERPQPIHFLLNGVRAQADVSSDDRLLDVLREQFGLTGTKDGCSEGECGACTVILDGLPALACLVPACQIRGKVVETVESVAPDHLAPLLEAGVTQCGACTPGVVMTATWLRRQPELVERFGLRPLLAGNLCRCTGYDGIVEGVERALKADRSA